MLKTRQKIFLFLAILVVLASVLSLTHTFFAPKKVFADNTVTSTWDGSPANDLNNVFENGTGTEEDPYLIENATQFASLIPLVEQSYTAFNNASVYYRLEANIDLNYFPFKGIGVGGNPFKANFDGNNCTISNFVYGTPETIDTINIGLFNYAEQGVIKNLTVSNATLSPRVQGSSNTTINCGIVCGWLTNNATLQNVKVTASSLNLSLYLNFVQVFLGGIVGKTFNYADVIGSSCEGSSITANLTTAVSTIEKLHIGLISGTVQSYASILNCSTDDQNNLTYTQSASGLNIPTYIGGIAGSVFIESYIKQSYSNFKNLSLTTGINTKNYIGGIVGNIKESFVQDCYAKNNLFKDAVNASTFESSVSYVGGLIGYADATNNLGSKKFLTTSYIVADTLSTDTFGKATVATLVGTLNVNSITDKTAVLLQNAYYVAKNGQTLTDYNIVGTNKYTGDNIATALDNTKAKSINNYVGFDTDYVWSNDLATQINEGYPILIGVGNSLVPNENETCTITIDNNGGTGGEANPNTYKADNISQTATITLPTKQDFVLLGWEITGYTGEKPTIIDTTLTIPAKTSGNLVLKALWGAEQTYLHKDWFSSLQTSILQVENATALSKTNLTEISFTQSMPSGYEVLNANVSSYLNNDVCGEEVWDINCGYAKIDVAYKYANSKYHFAFISPYTIFAPTNVANLFSYEKLTNITFNNFNTSKSTNLSGWFSYCYELTNLNLSIFDTSNVTDMSNMFYYCSKLSNLNISSFNTAKVTTMGGMFSCCEKLSSLDLKHFDMQKVENVSTMFGWCEALSSIDVTGWQTSALLNMSQMFYGCSSITTLSLSGLNTSFVVNMTDAFRSCSALTSLDLSGWVIGNIATSGIFTGCDALHTLSTPNSVGITINLPNGSWYQSATNLNGTTTLTDALKSKTIYLGYQLTANPVDGTISNLNGWVADNNNAKIVLFVKDGLIISSLPEARKDNYTFACWNTMSNGSGTDIVAGTSTISTNTSIYAKYLANTYEISIVLQTVDQNGISETSQNISVVADQSQTYQVPVEENYAVTNISQQNSSVTLSFDNTTNILTLSNPTANDTVTITITKNTYTISLQIANNVGGSVEFASGFNSTVYHGQGTQIVVTPSSSYRFDFATGVSISENGYIPTQTANGFAISNIQNNLTIMVTFIKTYNITVNVSDNAVGSVSFDNSDFKQSLQTTVDAGSEVIVYQQILTNKQNTNVFVNWVDSQNNQLGTADSLTLTNIASDYTITAVYGIKYYTLDITINQQTQNANNVVEINGNTVSNGQQINNLQYNQSISLTFNASEDSYVDSVVVDQTTLTSNQIDSGSYSFNLLQNSTVTISFVDYLVVNVYAYSNTLDNQQTYNNTNYQNYVGFSSTTNSILATQKYKANQTATLFAVANEKYVFDGWFVNADFQNTALSTSAEYSFAVQNAATLYAKFSINTYTITFKQTLIDETGTNTTTLDTIQSYFKGSLQLVVSAPANYNFVEINSNCGAIYTQNTSTISVANILASDTVIITFEKQYYTLNITHNQGGNTKINGQVATNVDKIYHNTDLQIDLEIETGYKLYTSTNVVVNGNCTHLVEQDKIVLQNIIGNITISITFTKYYTVTIQSNNASYGQVGFDIDNLSSQLSQEFDAGSNITVFANSNNTNAYEFKRWTDQENIEVATTNQYAIQNLQQNLTLTAVFAKVGYSISVILDQEITNANNSFTINGQNVNYLDGQDYAALITINYNLDQGSYLEKIEVSTVSGTQQILPEQIQNNQIQFLLVTNITAKVYIKAYKFNINLIGVNGLFKFDDNSTSKTLTAYDTATATLVADEGYRFLEFMQDVYCCDVSTTNQNGQVTIDNFVSTGSPETTVNITAQFTIIVFEVVFNYGSNGSIMIGSTYVSPMVKYTYNYGENLTIKFYANNEYYLNKVVLNSIDITDQVLNGVYLVENLQQNLSFEVDFGIKKYSFDLQKDFADVTYQIYANGVLTTENYFESGSYLEINFNIPLGYYFDGYYNADKTTLVYPSSTYGFTLTADTTLYAKILAEVVINASENGYVTLNGSTYNDRFEYGTVVTINAVADLGYQLSQYKNNLTVNQDGTFVVTKYTVVEAVFESKPVQVVLSADEYASINTYINGIYKIGDTISINTIITQQGYHFVGYSGMFAGELENILKPTYTILAQDAENGRVEIHADIELDIFEVMITSNYGGKLSLMGMQTYNYGTLVNIEVEIYDKYELSSLLYNQTENIQNFDGEHFSFSVVEPTTVEFVFAPLLWNDVAKMPEGMGTSKSPYLITTAEELAFISWSINNGIPEQMNQLKYDYAYYKIMNTIDLSGRFWTPIGTTEHPFNGIFDFNFNEITNLEVVDDVSLYKYGGLFDVIGSGKVINQFRNYTTLVIFIIVGSVVLALFVLLIIYIEKRHRKPKRVIILPPHLKNQILTNNDNKNINKPDISKLLKK